MSDGEVLVLEPDATTRSQISETLERLDIDTVAYGSVADALGYAHWPRIEAVIVNMKTLRSHGWPGKRAATSQLKREIARLRKAREAAPATRRNGRPLAVIVTSDLDTVAEHEAALDAGAGLYLPEKAATSPAIMRAYIGSILRTRGDETLPSPQSTAAPVRAPRQSGGVFDLPTQHLRSENGRLSAARIADALGVPLKRLAETLKVGYTTVQKTSDSASLQTPLAPFANVLAVLNSVFEGDPQRVRAWLVAEHDHLGGKSPQQVMLTPGGVAGVEQLVNGAWLGIPD